MSKAFASIVAGTLLGCLAVFADDAKTEVVGDFSSDLSGWEFSLGKEFPGAQGNFWRDEKEGSDGKGAACLLGDFSGGGAYVAMNRGFSEKLDVKAVEISFKTSDISGIVFRISDSSGQTFQQHLDLKESDTWQTVKVTDVVGKQGAGHWGGANDGQWHGPATGMSLILDKGRLKSPDSGKGTLVVEKVVLTLK